MADYSDLDALPESAPRAVAQAQPSQKPSISQAPNKGSYSDLDALPDKAPAGPVTQPGAVDWGKFGQDMQRAPMAGVAKFDDLMMAGSHAMKTLPPFSALPNPDLPKETGLQEYQRQTGKPNYPLAYDIASNWPAMLVPGVGPEVGLAGFVGRVALPGAASGALMEGAEEASAGKPLDPKEIGKQAALAAVANTVLHPFQQALFHPIKSANAVKSFFQRGEKDAAVEAGGFEPVEHGPSLPSHVMPKETEAELAAERSEQVRLAKEQQGSEEQARASRDQQAKEQEQKQLEQSHDAAANYWQFVKPQREASEAAERSGNVLQGKLEYRAQAEKTFGKTKEPPPPPRSGSGEAPPGEGPPGGGAQPPDRQPTVREEAVDLRQPFTELTEKQRKSLEKQWRPMLQAKYVVDQAEHNFRTAFNAMMERLPAQKKHGLLVAKRQVLPPEQEEELRNAAAMLAGIEKEPKFMRLNERAQVSVIRQAHDRSMPLVKYAPSGTSLNTLMGEVKFWRQKFTDSQKEYERVRDVMNVTRQLGAHESVELEHGGRRYVVKHSVQSDIWPQGNALQNAEYDRLLAEGRRQALAVKAAMNGELEPSMKALTDMLEGDDPEMAKVMCGRKPIEADDKIVNQVAKEGLADYWKEMVKGLVKQDQAIRQLMGIGLIAAGQLSGQKAEAKTKEEYAKQQQGDLSEVGTGLTLLGAVMIGGPKLLRTQAGKKATSLAGHLLFYIPDHTLFPALRAGAKMLKALPGSPDLAQLAFQATLSRANWDVIRPNADPQFVGKIATLYKRWARAVAGQGLIPEAPAGLQAWLRGPHMTDAELAAEKALTPIQKGRLRELRGVQDEGARLLKGEIARLEKLDPTGSTTRGLQKMLHVELDMNWDRNSPTRFLQRGSIWNLTARAFTMAAQSGNTKLHFYHLLEMFYSVPARAGADNFVEAERLMATGDKGAQRFVKSFNMTLPVHGHFSETSHSFTDKMALLWERATNKIPGYKAITQSAPIKTAKKGISGQLTESFKTGSALLAFSEQTARDMRYSSGRQLRHDLAAWLNREPHATSSEFTEAKGMEALGRILGGIEQTIAGSPAGFKVGLVIDRLAQKQPFYKNIFPFTRTAIIAARARASLAADTLTHIQNGEYSKARATARAIFLMSGMSVLWLGGHAADREWQAHLLQTDPLEAKRYHDMMNRFALLGRSPGAFGGALQAAGVENQLGKYNFRAPHTQPALFWPTRVGSPVAVQTIKAGITLLDSQAKEAAKVNAVTLLAAQAGATGIPNLMSFMIMERIAKHAIAAEEQGGNIEYTFTDEPPFGMGNFIERGHKVGIKGALQYEHPHYVNSHMTENTPAEAALRSFALPGEAEESEELQFNDMVEYNCEQIVKEQYGHAYQTLRKQYAKMTPIAHWYNRVRNRTSRGTASKREKEKYDNVHERYTNLEHEMNKPVRWGTIGVKPSEFWQFVLEKAHENPAWIKGLGG